MGQYHMLVNLDKREYIYSHQLGEGLRPDMIIDS